MSSDEQSKKMSNEERDARIKAALDEDWRQANPARQADKGKKPPEEKPDA